MKQKVLSIIVMLLGLSFFSYPFISFTINDIKANKLGIETINSIERISSVQKSEIMNFWKKQSNYLDNNGTIIEDPFFLDRNQISEKDNIYTSKLTLFKEKNTNIKNGIKKNIIEKDVIGYILIPSIGVKNKIYCKATDKHLQKGVAQIDGTDMPYGGKGRRCVIAGHRGTYKISMMFRHLDRLKKNDDIFIYTIAGRLHYKVKDNMLINPTDTQKLLPIKGLDILSLITCDPFPTGEKRLVVNAIRLEKNSIGKHSMIDNYKNDINLKEISHTKNIKLLNNIIAIFCIIIYMVLFYKLFFIITKSICK